MIAIDLNIVTIDATFSDYSSSITKELPVQQYGNIDQDGRDFLYKCYYKSKIDFDFESHFKFNITDILNFRHKNIADYGVGCGLTGFDIKQEFVSDIRLREEPSKNFNELLSYSNNMNQNFSEEFSVLLPFLSAFYQFKVGDQIEAGIDIRYYFKTDEEGMKFRYSKSARVAVGLNMKYMFF